MNTVNIRKLQKDILMPMFSEEGSNARLFEGHAYSQFVKCTREVASKAVIESSIMFFLLLSPNIQRQK